MHGFKKYLSDVHQLSINDIEDNVFYLIPLDGCDYCASENMRSLLMLSDNRIRPILIGIENSSRVEEVKNDLIKRRLNLLFDKKAQITKYETGFFKPIIVHIKSGELVYYRYITDDLINEVHEYLQNI